MKYNDVMLDLETMDSNPTAAVVQIGAVAFNLKDIGPTFKATVDLEDAMRYGTVSGSTIKWWLEQSDAARASILDKDSKPLQIALIEFSDWVHRLEGKAHKFWAHATFDHPILLNAFSKSAIQRPFHYRQCRDLRTLEDFWGGGIAWPQREGTAHDALDDAMFQAKAAQLMLRKAWGK